MEMAIMVSRMEIHFFSNLLNLISLILKLMRELTKEELKKIAKIFDLKLIINLKLSQPFKNTKVFALC